MVVISIERVRCVLPARGQVTATPVSRSIGIRGTVIALAVIWLSSIIIAVPDVVNFDVGLANHTDNDISKHSLVVCQSTWNSLQRSIYSLILLVVSYLLPQVVLYVNYGRLAAYLWSRRPSVAPSTLQPRAGDAGGHGGSSAAAPITARTAKIIKMLVTIAILFLVSWTPYFTIMTIGVICILFLCRLTSVHVRSKPNTHRRCRRDSTVELSRVGI